MPEAAGAGQGGRKHLVACASQSHRPRVPRLRAACAFVLLCLVTITANAFAEGSGAVGGRAKLMYGTDNNAGQTYSGREVDALTRFLAAVDGKINPIGKNVVEAEAIAAVEKYFRLYEYDRIIGEAGVGYSRYGALDFKLAGSVRAINNFQQHWRDYQKWRLKVELGKKIGRKSRVSVFAAIDDYNTDLGKPLDYVSQHYSFTYGGTPFAGLRLGTAYKYEHREFYARAREKGPEDTTILTSRWRKDDGNSIAVFAAAGREWIWRAEYTFTEWNSNSYATGYSGHKLALAAGGMPTDKITLLVSLALQQRHWHNSLDGISTAEQSRILVGEENENLNSLNVQLTRSLVNRWEMLIAYSRYSNEFSGESYFTRDQLFLGVQRHF
jgi:hypothetical protein